MDMSEVRNELQKSYGTGYNDGYSKGYEDGCADRKEGEWIKVDDSVQPICSNCGMSCSGIHRNADYSVVPTWNYCPNCGADMRGLND